MRQLNAIMNDAALTSEEYREIRKAVVEPRYDNLAGRQVIPVRKVGIGRQEYGHDVLSESGAADLIKKATNFPGMDVNKTRSLTWIPKIGVSFAIAREDLLSSREYGEPLNTLMARRASRLVQNKENTMIVAGTDTPYSITGLYEAVASGNTVSGSDWGSNDPTTDVISAIGKIGSTFNSDTLLLNPVQYKELLRRNTNTDKMYIDLIRDMGITPKIDKDITAGTGLLMATGADIAELIVAEDLDVEEDYVLSNQSYIFNAFLRSVPVVYESDALCTITGI